jgi:hypothetical protein
LHDPVCRWNSFVNSWVCHRLMGDFRVRPHALHSVSPVSNSVLAAGSHEA